MKFLESFKMDKRIEWVSYPIIHTVESLRAIGEIGTIFCKIERKGLDDL